jgi:hypothetical protein
MIGLRRIKTQLSLRFTLLAALTAVTGLLVPPEMLVKSFLPPQYASFHLPLISGLWLTKACLLFDAFLLVIWPFVKNRWFAIDASEMPPRGVCSPEFSREDVVLMALLLLLALTIRIPGLSSGYSFDELTISMSMAEKPLTHLLMRAEPWRLVPALSAFILYKLFGICEICGRAISFISGTLSVPLLYLLARQWMKTRYAVASAVVLAVSTFHIWYSQMLTSYAPALFLILLSMVNLEQCLRDDRPARWFWWGVSVTMLLLVNFQLGLFSLFAETLRVAFPSIPGRFERNMLIRCFVVLTYSCAIAATVFSASFFDWASIVTGLAGSADAHFVSSEPRGTVPGQLVLFAQWLSNEYGPWPLQLATWTAFVAGGIFVLRRRSPLPMFYLLAPTLILWCLFAAGVIRRITPRHSFFTLIPFSVFVGIGVVGTFDLVRTTRGRARNAAVLALATTVLGTVLAGATISLWRYASVERFPFKPTASFLNAAIRDGEKVYFGGFGYHEFKYYSSELICLEDYSRLGTVMDSGKSFLLVYFGEQYLQAMPDALRERVLESSTVAFMFSGREEQAFDPHECYVRRFSPFASRPELTEGRGRPQRVVWTHTRDRRNLAL